MPKVFFSDAVYCKFVSHPLVLMFRIFTTAATNVCFDFTVGEGHVLMLWTFVFFVYTRREIMLFVCLCGGYYVSTVNSLFRLHAVVVYHIKN